MPYFSICRLAKSMILIMPSMSAMLAFLKRCPISLLYLALLKNMTMCSWPRLKEEGLSF